MPLGATWATENSNLQSASFLPESTSSLKLNMHQLLHTKPASRYPPERVRLRPFLASLVLDLAFASASTDLPAVASAVASL